MNAMRDDHVDDKVKKKYINGSLKSYNNFSLVLTQNPGGAGADGFSSQVDGLAHVDTRVLSDALKDVQRHVSEVTGGLEP